LFSQYITARQGAQKLFKESGTFDLPAMKNVVPRDESLKLMSKQRYASLTVTELQGYDNQSLSETIVLTQLYFMDKIDIDEYLKRLSRIHRNSLLRLSKVYKNQLNMDFIRNNLGGDFE
jgi:hypothetical protein